MRSVIDENTELAAERRGRGSAPGFGRESKNGNPALGPSRSYKMPFGLRNVCFMVRVASVAHSTP